jgi:hypothetical protein
LAVMDPRHRLALKPARYVFNAVCFLSKSWGRKVYGLKI